MMWRKKALGFANHHKVLFLIIFSIMLVAITYSVTTAFTHNGSHEEATATPTPSPDAPKLTESEVRNMLYDYLADQPGPSPFRKDAMIAARDCRYEWIITFHPGGPGVHPGAHSAYWDIQGIGCTFGYDTAYFDCTSGLWRVWDGTGNIGSVNKAAQDFLTALSLSRRFH